MVPITHTCPVPSDDASAIAAEVGTHFTLEEVTRWAFSQKPPRLFPDAKSATHEHEGGKGLGFDLVVQDEYTHDVVVPWSERLFLVYDTT